MYGNILGYYLFRCNALNLGAKYNLVSGMVQAGVAIQGDSVFNSSAVCALLDTPDASIELVKLFAERDPDSVKEFKPLKLALVD